MRWRTANNRRRWRRLTDEQKFGRGASRLWRWVNAELFAARYFPLFRDDELIHFDVETDRRLVPFVRSYADLPPIPSLMTVREPTFPKTELSKTDLLELKMGRVPLSFSYPGKCRKD